MPAEKPENENPGPHTERNPGTTGGASAVALRADNAPGKRIDGDAAELSVAESGARRTSSHPPSSNLGPRSSQVGSDTLLSLPIPAKREELVDERLSALESKLGELTRRLDGLERRSIHLEENPQRPRWIWLAFLAVLALAWQIMARTR